MGALIPALVSQYWLQPSPLLDAEVDTELLWVIRWSISCADWNFAAWIRTRCHYVTTSVYIMITTYARLELMSYVHNWQHWPLEHENTSAGRQIILCLSVECSTIDAYRHKWSSQQKRSQMIHSPALWANSGGTGKYVTYTLEITLK